MCSWDHRCIEGVAADNLVRIGRWNDARVDERIQPIDNELRALEAHHWHPSLTGGMLQKEG